MLSIDCINITFVLQIRLISTLKNGNIRTLRINKKKKEEQTLPFYKGKETDIRMTAEQCKSACSRPFFAA